MCCFMICSNICLAILDKSMPFPIKTLEKISNRFIWCINVHKIKVVFSICPQTGVTIYTVLLNGNKGGGIDGSRTHLIQRDRLVIPLFIFYPKMVPSDCYAQSPEVSKTSALLLCKEGIKLIRMYAVFFTFRQAHICGWTAHTITYVIMDLTNWWNVTVSRRRLRIASASCYYYH